MTTMQGYEDYQKQVEAYNESIPSGRGIHYFCFILKDGRYVNIGSTESEAESTEMGYRDGGGRHFEIFGCKSRNLNEVHRQFKRHLLDSSHDLQAATNLISRKPAKEKQKREKPFGEGIF